MFVTQDFVVDLECEAVMGFGLDVARLRKVGAADSVEARGVPGMIVTEDFGLLCARFRAEL